MAEDLDGFVRQAVTQGSDFATFKRDLFQRLLAMGSAAVDQFLQAPGSQGRTA